MTYEKALQKIREANAEGRPANLIGADLRDANLYGANLCRAILAGANLVGANLNGVNLNGADLYRANLCRANLVGANLRGANLTRANLTGANLCRANLVGANLRGANLVGANLGGLLVVARATRSDGYEYFCWTSILSGLVICAGCRTWMSFEAAREHCRTETNEKYRAEALDIIDFLEKRYAK